MNEQPSEPNKSATRNQEEPQPKMSDHQSKLEAINNGLKAIEFIQKNRESLIKTYGRSAIGEPKTKDRAKAWEAFASESSTSNPGSQRGGKSQTGDSIPEDHIYTPDDNRSVEPIPQSKGDHNKANDSRSNTGRDVDNPSQSSQAFKDGFKEIIKSNPKGPILNTNGGAQPNPSNNTDGTTDVTPGPQIRERADIDDLREFEGTRDEKSVAETTQGDLDQIMEEAENEPKKKLKSLPKLKLISNTIPAESQTVKKTTEESSSSPQREIKSSFKAGAIQSAHQLEESQPALSAAAESAHKHASNAKTTDLKDDNLHDQTKEDLKNIEAKLDAIAENQTKILTKLQSLSELKEEVAGIKKTLTNQSLALSTIEKYISDLMIVIPRSGVADSERQPEINPDLKMVIGRDNTRGLKDVAKRYQDSEKIDISDDFYVPREVDSRYILKDIDNSRNNAANFIPENDSVSIRIIKDIVEKEVQDLNARKEMLALIDECNGKIETKELYKMISDIIY